MKTGQPIREWLQENANLAHEMPFLHDYIIQFWEIGLRSTIIAVDYGEHGITMYKPFGGNSIRLTIKELDTVLHNEETYMEESA